jgi:pimeloyl-ACP methyl ester carboxylesterase
MHYGRWHMFKIEKTPKQIARRAAKKVARKVAFAAVQSCLGVQTLMETDAVVIRWLAGDTASLVVAFTGIGGNMGGLPPDEFLKAGSADGKNHVIFISDPKQTYFSAPDLRASIGEFVRGFIAQHGIKAVKTIGNSMGGYGAILFSREFPVQTAVAFVPAISLEPQMIAEPDWNGFRDALGAERVQSLVEHLRNPATHFHLIFGDLDPEDRRQCAKAPAFPNVDVTVIAGKSHGLARWLKKTGLLSGLVQALFANDQAGIARSVAEINALALQSETSE